MYLRMYLKKRLQVSAAGSRFRQAMACDSKIDLKNSNNNCSQSTPENAGVARDA